MTGRFAAMLWTVFRRRHHQPTPDHPHPAELGPLVSIELELWGGPRDGQRITMDEFCVHSIEAHGPAAGRLEQLARTALVTGCVPTSDLPKVTRWSGTYTAAEGGGGMVRIVPAQKAGR